MQSSVALASNFPGTGAPISAARAMKPSGDPTNPFSYPFLADLAKSLAKNGFPASFFLGLDSKSGPGIDLRTILLYEAGVLKSPVKIIVPTRLKKQDSSFPSLTMSSIPDSSGEMPSIAPKLKAENIEDPNNSGSGIKQPELPKENELSVDVNKFSKDLAVSGYKNEVTAVTPDVATVAMIPPHLSVENPTTTAENSFRFWTIPASPAAVQPNVGKNATYDGSYVMMSPEGLKSVVGRTFSLKSGRIFACSRALPIVIEAPEAKVTVTAGASAFVEILKAGTTRVRVLESGGADRVVTVKFNSNAKPEELKLSAGSDFIVSDHSLSEAEKSVQGKSAGTTSGGDNWSRSEFSAKAFVGSDKFFSSDLANQNLEQRAAMLSLIKRLK